MKFLKRNIIALMPLFLAITLTFVKVALGHPCDGSEMYNQPTLDAIGC